MAADPSYFNVTGFAFPVVVGGVVPPPPPPPIPQGDNVTTVAPSCIVRQMLVDLGLVTSPYQAFCPHEPDVPDYTITVQDTEGQDLGRVAENYRSEQYGFQIRVRGRTAAEVYDKAGNIAITLDEQVSNRDVTVRGVTYLVVTVIRRGRVMGIGHESTSKRHIAVFNGLIVISQRESD